MKKTKPVAVIMIVLLTILVLRIVVKINDPTTAAPSGQKTDRPQGSAEELWSQVEMREIPLSAATGEALVLRNLYFILDGSGSMGDKPDKKCGGEQRFRAKIDGARWAIDTFLKTIPEDVNIGLYVFDNNGEREELPLGTENRQIFLDKVNHLEVGGGTPLAEAIRWGTERLVQQYQRQLGYGEFRLVVVTDGEASSLAEAAVYAAEYGVPLYTIGLCVGPDHPLRRYSVSYRAADNFEDLAEGLQETLAELPSFDAASFDQLTEPEGNDAAPPNESDPK